MLSSDPHHNWLRLQDALLTDALRPRHATVILVDGDRTLTQEDTSRLFLDRAGLSLAPIKEAFARHGYSYPGFLFHASVYLQVPEPIFDFLCQEIAASVSLYAGAAEFLLRAVQVADVYVVTAGISPIWSHLLARNGLDSVRVLGGIFPGARYLVGREEKGRICQYMVEQGRRVVAFGDSDVDALMLQAAEKAVVVVNHRRNDDLLPHLRAHRGLSQISHCEHVHPSIPRIEYSSAHHILERGYACR